MYLLFTGLKKPFFTFATAGLLLGMTASTPAYAGKIDLANEDFNDDDVSGILAIYGSTIEVPGWIETGPLEPRPELGGAEVLFYGGVFNNVPFSIFPAVGNSSEASPADRLGFLGVDPDQGTADRPAVSIYQGTSTKFKAGENVTFSLDVGPSTSEPARRTDPGNPLAKLILSIGYLDTGDVFVPIGVDLEITEFVDDSIDDPNEVKSRDQTLIDDPTEFNLLKNFSVTAVDPTAGDASLLDKDIAVRISQSGGDIGRFIFDSARLSQVPEPTSLALLGVAGLLVTRRRRG